MDQILLIIPCYNEEKRLNLNEFLLYSTKQNQQNSHLKVSFLFANDGSKDSTSVMIQNFIVSHNLENDWFLFNNPQNTGKANVIYNAFQWSKLNTSNQYNWYGFWDADLATPLSEIESMIQFKNLFYPEHLAVFGSRVLKLGSSIVRKPIRHYLGRAFATVAYLILKTGCYDSQCGAKLFKKEIADTAFREPFISRWVFDLEIILRISEQTISEYPLKKWADIEGSKVNLSKEIFRVFMDLLKIRAKYILSK